MEAKISTSYGFVFWFHLFITVLSWFAPFLFSWYLLVPFYGLVLLQFAVFGRCILNRAHDLSDEQTDSTFYAFILEAVGFKPDYKRVKRFVRFYLYFILSAMTLMYQVYLGNAPILFFK
jgi:hypothetical protein